MNGSAAEFSPLATEILSYMASHPDAQDTLDGIVEWWLLEHRIRRQTSLVSAALHELIERGLVSPTSARGRTRYRINEAKWPEIREICRRLEEEEAEG